jgi:D-alanyl-D-alanine carboxypeptidase
MGCCGAPGDSIPWTLMTKRILVVLLIVAVPALAQLPAATQAAIDEGVQKLLTDTGCPSVSIAVVKDGKIAYEHAYGSARLEPAATASAGMRYKIGSNSKQLTATAILLLAEDGKLSLDDPVSRFIPGLTRGNEVTIRQLLSHTSGYQDYYPLDYVAPFMARQTAPQGILDVWAKKALDFDPGTQWQYSNTNYSIAGLIVEKISSKPLVDFLRSRVFGPLHMTSVSDVDREPWRDDDPVGYTRFALGPSRPSPPEGSGWAYAAGELAMTAHDLALWDISLMNGTVLKPASMTALTTEVKLKNGAGTGYALGLAVSNNDGHRKWAHTGGMSGFLSSNFTRPDEHLAVTVLTNGETRAYARISRMIEDLLVAKPEDPQAAPALALVRKVFHDLQQGRLDRADLTADLNSYFTPQAVADFEASLKPLGEPAIRPTGAQARGGMMVRGFQIRAGGKVLALSTYFMPDGKLAQYLISIDPQQ